MTSTINASYPVEGTPTTISVRENFQAAHDEITALQATTANLIPPAPFDSHAYGRLANTWVQVLALTGGAITGNLSVAGGLTSSGATTLAATSATTLTVSGNATLQATSAATLTVSGLATLASATINGTGTALYVPNGAIQTLGQVSANTAVITNAASILGGGTALNVPNGSIATAGNLTVSGAASLGSATIAGGTIINGSGTALYVPNGAIQTLGQVSANTAVITNSVSINGAGTALNVPNGSIATAGTLTVSGSASIGSATIGATNITAGGTALYVPNGSIQTLGDLSANNAIIGNQASVNGGGIALYVPNGNMQTLFSLYVGAQGFKPGGGVWADSSDIRTKDNVADYTRGLDAVLQLRPVSFQHNGRGGTVADGRTFVGLIANEALDVMPEMVSTTEQKLDPDDDHVTEILSLEATALIYALTNAVKELAARIVTLEGAAATRGAK